MSLLFALIGTLAFAIAAPVLGCLLAGLDRKITARMQGRVGPPLLQPYYDVRKLIEKDNVSVNSSEGTYITCALVFTLLAGGIFYSGGNLLMSVFVITLAGLFFIIAAYSTRSPYAELGANRETLQVTYRGKNIAEVLDMTVDDALAFFENIPGIKRKLQTLHDVGLGYIRLGQPATTLSGGEAQRVKLSSELQRRQTGKTFYILDEPTTGLHFEDVRQLLEVLERLVDAGNTVLVIEHNLDVIKCADRIIDLGPEGGDRGGTIVAQGTPEEVAEVEGSYTGAFVKRMLEDGRL